MERYDHIQTGLEKIFGLYGVVFSGIYDSIQFRYGVVLYIVGLYGGGYSIENVWRDVKVKLVKVEAQITSASDLYATKERCLYDVTSQRIKDLYMSLPRKLKSCIKMKGHMTKY